MRGNGYPRDWNKRRRRVYQRDNYKCQECGKKGGKKGNAELQAHHIVPKSKGGSHDLKNLKTLCRSCHAKAHSHLGAAKHRPQKGFWGWAHRRADKELNSLYDGCPNCNKSDLNVRWERLGFRKKVKVLQCTECGKTFEERIKEDKEGKYLDLEPVAKIEDIEPAKSAFLQQVKKNQLRKETKKRVKRRKARETFGMCPNCGEDTDIQISDSWLTKRFDCEDCGATLKQKLFSKQKWKMTEGYPELKGETKDLLQWEQIVIEQMK